MPPPIIINKIANSQEIVICDSDIAVQAHKGLFSFKDDAYIKLLLNNRYFRSLSKDNQTGGVFLVQVSEILHLCCLQQATHTLNIHLVMNWEHLLQTAVWSTQVPPPNDVLNLLSTAGLSDGEILDLKGLNTCDIFIHLLYKKRFDILRKICHYAKGQIINHLVNKPIPIISYLFSTETQTIVASSL